MTMDIGFASGLDERQPVVILLDASGSMARPASNPRIAEVDAALTTLFESVRSQARLRARVETCLITFGSRVRVYDAGARALVPAEQADPDRAFVPVDKLSPPRSPRRATHAWNPRWTSLCGSPRNAAGHCRPEACPCCAR